MYEEAGTPDAPQTSLDKLFMALGEQELLIGELEKRLSVVSNDQTALSSSPNDQYGHIDVAVSNVIENNRKIKSILSGLVI